MRHENAFLHSARRKLRSILRRSGTSTQPLPAELIPLTQVRPGQKWIAEKQGKMPLEAVQLTARKHIRTAQPES